jgi:hypothetical protein
MRRRQLVGVSPPSFPLRGANCAKSGLTSQAGYRREARFRPLILGLIASILPNSPRSHGNFSPSVKVSGCEDRVYKRYLALGLPSFGASDLAPTYGKSDSTMWHLFDEGKLCALPPLSTGSPLATPFSALSDMGVNQPSRYHRQSIGHEREDSLE